MPLCIACGVGVLSHSKDGDRARAGEGGVEGGAIGDIGGV